MADDNNPQGITNEQLQAGLAHLVEQTAKLAEAMARNSKGLSALSNAIDRHTNMIREVERQVHTLDARVADLYDRAELKPRDESKFVDNLDDSVGG